MGFKENYIMEGGLGRLWQHTKDMNTFAIIGSKDKDTREDRSSELRDLMFKYKDKLWGYNNIKGAYRYEDGSRADEYSRIIYNISKEDALRIAKEINQETIVWKDKDFFGIIKVPNGEVDIDFTNGDKNMNFSQQMIDMVGGSSQLVGKNWKNNKHNSGKPFVFEAYLLQPRGGKDYGTCDYYLLCKENVSENGDGIQPFTIKGALEALKNIWD